MLLQDHCFLTSKNKPRPKEVARLTLTCNQLWDVIAGSLLLNKQKHQKDRKKDRID
jgi:hypothetical protein